MKRKTHASSTRLIRKPEAWMKKLADPGPVMRGSQAHIPAHPKFPLPLTPDF